MQLRNRCTRLVPTYNHYYNPYKLLLEDLLKGYSLYVYKEPLFDNRAIVVLRLLAGHIITSASIRPRTAWV